ncbi:MAG: hypothetical protein O9301_13660 [Leptospira sp.]|nr:hypothetical protein [Leptospira sp.]
MKRKILLALIALASTGVFALEDIEKVLVQKANTPEEKKVVREYLLKVAKQHKEVGEKYRGLAKGTKGGKAVYQEARKQEMLELAKKFEDDAKVYEEEAAKLK